MAAPSFLDMAVATSDQYRLPHFGCVPICLGQEVAGQRADRVDGRQHTRAVGAPDRQIAGVVLEQDTGMIADWTGMIITAYVGGRSIEKVARVFARRP